MLILATDRRQATEHLTRTSRNMQPHVSTEESYNSQHIGSWARHPWKLRCHHFQVDILLEQGSILPFLNVDADSMLDTEQSLLHNGCLNLGPQGIVVISCPCAMQDGITAQRAQGHRRLSNLRILQMVRKVLLEYISLMPEELDDLLLQL